MRSLFLSPSYVRQIKDISAAIKRHEAQDARNFWSPTILIFKNIEDPGNINDEVFYQGIYLSVPELLAAFQGIRDLKLTRGHVSFQIWIVHTCKTPYTGETTKQNTLCADPALLSSYKTLGYRDVIINV